MRLKISKTAENLLNLIYPQNIYCICCGDSMSSDHLHGICDDCIGRIVWNTDNPFRHLMEDFAFDDLWPCCRYSFSVRRIVQGLKLSGKTYIAENMGMLMGERLKQGLEEISSNNGQEIIITEVPMYKEKEKKRGFNQSKLLAEYVSKESGIRHSSGLLIKTEATASMRLSSADERRQMQQDAFKVNPECSEFVKGKNIILVDDVVTTGSTADACSRTLKNAGAGKVIVLCYACGKGPIYE